MNGLMRCNKVEWKAGSLHPNPWRSRAGWRSRPQHQKQTHALQHERIQEDRLAAVSINLVEANR
jgi:hypothetical protein